MESLKDLDALPMVISVTNIDWLGVIFGFVQFFCIFKYLSDPDNLRDFIKSVKIIIYLLIWFIVMMFLIDLLFCAIFVPFLPQPDETESSDDEDVLISDELQIILHRVICVPFITFSISLILAIKFPYKHVNHTKKINIFPLIMTFEKSVIGTEVRRSYKVTALKRITSLLRSLHRVSDIRSESANKFKKAHDNTLSEHLVDNMSVKMKSVGAIVSSSVVKGTCFRVGSKYVMTAFHVVENIINPRKLPSIADNDWSKLGDQTVYIRFTASVLDILRPIFYIKPDVIYMNKQLDIAVLELKSLEGLPRSLKLSKDMGDVKCVSIIGFGHPTDPRKQLDANCEVLNINYIITALDNYVKANPSILQLNGLEPGGLNDAYNELGNKNKFACHTFLEHGSSGAPAIEENEVVGILIEGTPGAYYRLRATPHFTASGIDKLPKNLMFELCVKTESIFNDMRSGKQILAADLFD